jgi:adenine-specific DNA methylase
LPILLNSNPKSELIKSILLEVIGRSPEDVVIVDPMAGGGSIPLEALRLALSWKPTFSDD